MDDILSSDFSAASPDQGPDPAPEQMPDASACRAPESFPDFAAPEPAPPVTEPAPEPKPKLIKAKRVSGLPRMTKALRARGVNKHAKKRPVGKPKLPDGRCRVQMSVRVMPDTLAALNKLGEKNPGWAVDKLVRMAKDAQLFKIPVDMF